jgi:anti-sigma regulatory factor (Ser/Thr protein kinase)
MAASGNEAMDVRARANTFRHEVLLYAGIDEFLRGTLEFVRESLDAGEQLLAMVSAAKVERLQEALGPEAGRVEFLDVEVVGRNPARMIPTWRAFMETGVDGTRSVRGISEPIWSARRPAELVEAELHESLLNRAFADVPAFSLLCVYDTEALAPGVIDHARGNHAFIVEDGDRKSSETFTGSPAVDASLGVPLAEPAVEPELFTFDDVPLRAVRALVSDHAARNGLDDDRASHLVLAVDEVASNSLRHGRSIRALSMWVEGDTLICEVRDRGRIEDPLVGCTKPPAGQEGGRGLWIANQVCDLVQVRSSAAGTVVRLHMSSD